MAYKLLWSNQAPVSSCGLANKGLGEACAAKGGGRGQGRGMWSREKNGFLWRHVRTHTGDSCWPYSLLLIQEPGRYCRSDTCGYFTPLCHSHCEEQMDAHLSTRHAGYAGAFLSGSSNIVVRLQSHLSRFLRPPEEVPTLLRVRSGTKNSIVKQITSPGWMHETSAWAWCTGKTQRNRVEREVGGGIGMGNTCNSMADSCQCMTKPTTIL